VTIGEAGRALRSREISCLELTNRCLDEIAKQNARLNAFITVTADAARKRARELDDELARGVDRGPLHGIPIAHKDLMWTRGVRTTSGSKLYADFVPEQDAVVVEKLDRAGAVSLGKTGLHELAYGVTSENPHFGVIRNPRDLERSPGGSSGGSGAAVAADMAFMATGTDTGGSIRIPATYCGVVGLKPTYGAVDKTRVHPLSQTLDHVGPLVRCVADARLTFEAMAEPGRPRSGQVASNGIRIGVPDNFYFSGVDAEVVAAVQRAARSAEETGARVTLVQVPDVDALNAVGRVILSAEASALYEPQWSRREDFGHDVLALLDQGRLVPATDYINAQRLRRKLLREFHALFRSIDVLFTPTSPITAPRIGQKQVTLNGEPHDTRLAATRFVRGMNVLGFPALSIPCGESKEGLPIGLQIIGRPFEEELLLSLGESIEPLLPRKV
jgi:aspartyl-tRNA(Asn)/glutamyl-tRNA(Gln) amidotransferase subunit A